MNQDRVAGIWKQWRGRMQESWGKLTDDPRAIAAGTRAQRAGRIQERHGLSSEMAARQLRDFFHRNRNWDLSNR